MRRHDIDSRNPSFRRRPIAPIVQGMDIVSISGSPAAHSRSAALLRWAEARLAGDAASTHHIALRELPAAALLGAHAAHPVLRVALERVAQADVVLISTPIYKAAYSGLLKVFLDLLPPDALRGKQVLALATGGSPGHLLALDYSLKPVLNALGARHLLDAVYATDSQLTPHETLGHVPDAALVERLERSLLGLFELPTPHARMPALHEAARPC